MAQLVVEIHIPLTPSLNGGTHDFRYLWIDDVEDYLASLDGSDGEEYDSGEELGDEYVFFVAAATEAQLIELATRVAQLPGVPSGVYVTVNDSEGEIGEGRHVDLAINGCRDALRSGTRSSLGEPHPRFAAHFTDPLYSDTSDNFAPFGTDEGADILAEAAQNPHALEQGTLASFLREDFDYMNREVNQPASKSRERTYALATSFGFSLMRVMGQIDAAGKELLIKALQRRIEISKAPPPQLATMLSDLRTFPLTPRRRPKLP